MNFYSLVLTLSQFLQKETLKNTKDTSKIFKETNK